MVHKLFLILFLMSSPPKKTKRVITKAEMVNKCPQECGFYSKSYVNLDLQLEKIQYISLLQNDAVNL